jgi:Zn-dependent M28 family amino/carboxypeptidase
VRARVHASPQVEVTTAPNVIGILRGSDPRLRDEYVFFSAHMDHVGVGAPVNGDSIYNGADDNASGTATILEIAEALSRASPRPRRSLAFLLVSGEEKGLFGSQWFSDHPTVPLARVVADLNVDMVGRNWEDTIVAVGKAQSSLGATVDSVARAHPELRLAVIDDPWPQERFYFRSDHYNFARKGVPILFFFNGVHEDYHLPSDEPAKIRSEKAARIARLVALTGWAVAEADARPRWDPAARAQVVETP